MKERISYIDRSATVAWCPLTSQAGLIAAGTVANAISDSFDASAALEIFSLDMGSSSEKMSMLGAVQTNDRFHSLAWSLGGADTGALPSGMLAGGLVDGSIKVFNPAAMMNTGLGNPLLADLKKLKGGVRALEFNPGMPHLLAAGAGDAEVTITDLSKPKEPSFYSPGTKTSGSTSDISCVAWNRKVQHILASTSHGGESVVWDLKQKRPVIRLDHSGNRMSVVEWR